MGECGDYKLGPKLEECYKMYNSGLPLTVDMQIPSAMQQTEVVLKEIFDRLMKQAALTINAAIRVGLPPSRSSGCSRSRSRSFPGSQGGA